MADTNLWRDRNKIFVAGIPTHADDAALYAKFEKFGEMFQSKVVYDNKTGKSKGFGFITFREYVNALEAVSQMNQTKWDKRVLNVRFLQPKAGSESTGDAVNAISRRPVKVFGPCPMGCTSVYVGNLSYDITEEVLRKVFDQCGAIKAVRFAEHIETKEFRGFGYVQFYESISCESAVKLDGMIVMGRPMNLDYGSRDEATEKAREELQKKLKKGVCHKFQAGTCQHGDDCKFAHVLKGHDTDDISQISMETTVNAVVDTNVSTRNALPTQGDSDAPICINYQKGKCKRGALCRFQHLGENGADRSEIHEPPAAVAATEVDLETPICQSFQKGKCKRGAMCRYQHLESGANTVITQSHPAPVVKEVVPTALVDVDAPICQSFQKGKCKRGTACRFQHIDPSLSSSTFEVPSHQQESNKETDDTPVCQNYQKGKCKRGTACRFLHSDTEPSTSSVPTVSALPSISVCRNFQLGRCARGVSCRFAHTDSPSDNVVVAKVPVAAVTNLSTDYQKRFQSVCYNWQNTRSCVRGAQCGFHHEGASEPSSPCGKENKRKESVHDIENNTSMAKKLKTAHH